MDLSIVLCTWNNCRRLAQTLDAIGRCTVPQRLRWEVVLVDNNSTDGTSGVAERFARHLPLRYVEEPRQGLSHARNTGLNRATGNLVVFADDDITPCVGWLEAYWAAYRERSTGFCFGGPLVSEFETGPPDSEILALAGPSVTGLQYGPEARVLAPHERFMGANWACPADALQAVGGFDPRLGLDASLGRRRLGEEWDLMERLRRHGILSWYLPHAVVTHFVPAGKCGIAYTAANWEGSGVYGASRAAVTTPFFHRRPHLLPYSQDRRPRLAGAPWHTYVAAARFLARWLGARMRGRNGYEAYVSWRFCRGTIRGFRERHDAGASGRAPAVTTPLPTSLPEP
jgi:glycosyltransferase involved in cell wall biosynthesis